jgi:hypothetical protein
VDPGAWGAVGSAVIPMEAKTASKEAPALRATLNRALTGE